MGALVDQFPIGNTKLIAFPGDRTQLVFFVEHNEHPFCVRIRSEASPVLDKLPSE